MTKDLFERSFLLVENQGIGPYKIFSGEISEQLFKNFSSISNKWDLNKVYSSIDEWHSDFDFIEKSLIDLMKFKGNLRFKSSLLDFFRLHDLISLKFHKLEYFVGLNLAVNAFDEFMLSLSQKLRVLHEIMIHDLGFLCPELLGCSNEYLISLISDDDFKHKKVFLEKLFRLKPFVLSESDEIFVSEYESMIIGFENTYFNLFGPNVTLPLDSSQKSGQIKINISDISNCLKHPDGNFRKLVIESLKNHFESNKYALVEIFFRFIKGNDFISKKRGFKSSLESRFFDSNISVDLFFGLLSNVNDNLGVLHDYIKLRSDVLGVDELSLSDLRVPLIGAYHVPFNLAKNIIFDSLSCFGDDYVSLISECFEDGWIDLYPSDMKDLGSFEHSTYFGPHPHILMNYADDLASLIELGHGIGHGIYDHIAISSQDSSYNEPDVFLHDIVSYLNEILIFRHLINNSDCNKEKLFHTLGLLDRIVEVFFHQTLNSEFENMLNDIISRGEQFGLEELCDLWHKLSGKYFGDRFDNSSDYSLMWGGLSGIFSQFSMYNHAMAFCIAFDLSSRFLSNEQGLTQKFANFMRSGGTDYSNELLKLIDIDIYDKSLITNMIREFTELLQFSEELYHKN